ncbi:hypothetical protein PILCRDRAFT_507547 [Piloderma croceum F 1598]|uniref:Uncharacterized protein n=1 Tax=Piloderma croceum (strain F 1598) TaxID=765440 RepID=A0A0C3FQ44_PILCF|nr:hypothetical protein PILCRDRAFT_507547 [Piloderma croceum F 1598]
MSSIVWRPKRMGGWVGGRGEGGIGVSYGCSSGSRDGKRSPTATQIRLFHQTHLVHITLTIRREFMTPSHAFPAIVIVVYIHLQWANDKTRWKSHPSLHLLPPTHPCHHSSSFLHNIVVGKQEPPACTWSTLHSSRSQ